MLETVKAAMQIVENNWDAEINRLIAAACADLGVVGVEAAESTTDPLLTDAIVLFVRWRLGSPDDYDKMLAAYESTKAMLITASGYGLPSGV